MTYEAVLIVSKPRQKLFESGDGGQPRSVERLQNLVRSWSAPGAQTWQAKLANICATRFGPTEHLKGPSQIKISVQF